LAATHSNLLSDSEIVSQILAGEISLFRALIQRYEKKLLSYLHRRCGNEGLVDDIYQETCIAIYSNLNQYKPEFAFGAWAFGIARNKSNEVFRKQKPQCEVNESDAVDYNSPAEQLEQVDSSSMFWNEARRLLNDDQFNTLCLRYQEDMSVKQISQHLQKSESNIKIHLFRARKALAGSMLLANHINQHSQLAR